MASGKNTGRPKNNPRPWPVCLSIAGSDSGGGAGIQADNRTFTDLKVWGTTAIAAITAQNPDQVAGSREVSPEWIMAQIQAVGDYFPVRAVKTGMLPTGEVIRAATRGITHLPGSPPLVVDPVMMASSGARLLDEIALQTLCDTLLPLAALITPNVPEACQLTGLDIRSVEEMERAAVSLQQQYHTSVLVKGGHLAAEAEAVDVLAVPGLPLRVLRLPLLPGIRFHGSGCVLSAAITAHLARGRKLPQAVALAKAYLHRLMAAHPRPDLNEG